MARYLSVSSSVERVKVASADSGASRAATSSSTIAPAQRPRCGRARLGLDVATTACGRAWVAATWARRRTSSARSSLREVAPVPGVGAGVHSVECSWPSCPADPGSGPRRPPASDPPPPGSGPTRASVPTAARLRAGSVGWCSWWVPVRVVRCGAPAAVGHGDRRQAPRHLPTLGTSWQAPRHPVRVNGHGSGCRVAGSVRLQPYVAPTRARRPLRLRRRARRRR